MRSENAVVGTSRGSIPHLTAELLVQTTGAPFNIVPTALPDADRQRHLRLNRHQRFRVGAQDVVVEVRMFRC